MFPSLRPRTDRTNFYTLFQSHRSRLIKCSSHNSLTQFPYSPLYGTPCEDIQKLPVTFLKPKMKIITLFSVTLQTSLLTVLDWRSIPITRFLSDLTSLLPVFLFRPLVNLLITTLDLSSPIYDSDHLHLITIHQIKVYLKLLFSLFSTLPYFLFLLSFH